MSKTYILRGLGVVSSVLLLTTPAWSWGHDGHRLVAKIAAKNLTPDTRQKLAAILQTDDAGLDAAMANAATWPDEIDKSATGTRDWHFIDVTVTAPFSLDGLCPDHNCVVDRIKEMSDRLQQNQTGFALAQAPDPNQPMTAQELSFLIHFVGDIHQPLHAATDGDRGGNCVKLTKAIPHSTTTEVHAVWDVDEVVAVFQDLANSSPTPASEDQVADALFQQYKKAGAGDWEKASVEDWAHESNDLARADVYKKLHIPNHTAAPGQCATGIAKVAITPTYLTGNVPDTEQQLMRAGIRLADMLNQICQDTGCQASPAGGSHN